MADGTLQSDNGLTFTDFVNSSKALIQQRLSILMLGSTFGLLCCAALSALTAEPSGLAVGGLAILVFGLSTIRILERSLENITFQKEFSNGDATAEKAGIRTFRTLKRTIATLISSFGLFILLTSSAGAYAWTQFSSSLALTESQMLSAEMHVTKFIPVSKLKGERERFANAVAERRSQLLNSFLGRSSDAGDPTIVRLAQSFVRLSVVFLVPVGFTLLFGLYVFPACAVNAYRESSFVRSISPVRILRTMRECGFDYFKLLTFSAVSGVVVTALTSFLGFLLLQFTSFPVAVICSASVLGIGFTCYWVMHCELLARVCGSSSNPPSLSSQADHVIEQIQ
jgi:hypothetical protein